MLQREAGRSTVERTPITPLVVEVAGDERVDSERAGGDDDEGCAGERAARELAAPAAECDDRSGEREVGRLREGGQTEQHHGGDVGARSGQPSPDGRAIGRRHFLVEPEEVREDDQREVQHLGGQPHGVERRDGGADERECERQRHPGRTAGGEKRMTAEDAAGQQQYV